MAQNHSSLDHLYSKELQSILRSLEEKRVKLRQQIKTTATAIVPVLLLGGFVLLQQVGLLIGLTIAIIILFQLYHRPFQEYRKQFKHQVIQRLVKHYKPDLVYNPVGGIPQAEFENSKIFTQTIDRYHCEDLLQGKIGDTLFRLSEVRAEHKTKDDTVTVFSGLFFVASFNKSFASHTVVLSDLLGQLLGNAGRRLGRRNSKLSNRPGELVKLEDPDFDRLFSVYSTDQVEARYILSTSLMQRLVEFLKLKDGRLNGYSRVGINLSFIRSKVYIAFPLTKNYFEPPSLFAESARVTFQDIQDYLADIKMAEDVIEELNLNRRIWGKS